jgi:hypothetical protein
MTGITRNNQITHNGKARPTAKTWTSSTTPKNHIASHGMVIFCILNKKAKATGWVPRSLSGWIRAADYCTVTVTLNG